MRSFALFAAFSFTLACQKPGQPNPPPAEPTASTSVSVDGPEGERDDGSDPDGKPERPGPSLPDGPLCTTDADCGDGICEGVGCGEMEGRCVARDRMCTRDLASYCGCDGATFQNSGSCPGARFAYRGACEPKLADGEACTDGRQCASGSCVGEGLEGCSPGAQGVCGQVACTMDLASYCGCNNVEFQASGSCPNRQFAYRGPCEG